MTLTRAERDQFTATTPNDVAYGEGACLETPPKLFELLHRRFKFDVDLTANEGNHLLPTWFGPGSTNRTDALGDMAWGMPPSGQRWTEWKAGFSNPPYGDFIPKILKKAIEEREKGFTSVFLLPMRAAGWFRDLVLPYYSELWYCSERIVFHYQGTPRPSAGVKVKAMLDGFYRNSDGWLRAVADGTNWSWTDTWGQPWTYRFGANEAIRVPAGALFDSIIVVYKPHLFNVHQGRGQFGLFPPPQRPNIFEVKTGELRF